MVICGGYLDTGVLSDEILCLSLEDSLWSKVKVEN